MDEILKVLFYYYLIKMEHFEILFNTVEQGTTIMIILVKFENVNVTIKYT